LQAVDEPILEFLRQHALPLRQFMLLLLQHLLARQRGLQLGRERGMLFLHAPIARQCAAKRNRKISFSGSIAHDSPSVPVCFREAGSRQSLKLARPLGGARGIPSGPYPDWRGVARDPGAEGAARRARFRVLAGWALSQAGATFSRR